MTIKGIGNAGVPSPDPRRVDGGVVGKRPAVTGADATARPSARLDAGADADVVELSADALSSRANTGVPPRETMPIARVKEIAARIVNGSYDRPEVQDVVLDRLAAHLDTLGETIK